MGLYKGLPWQDYRDSVSCDLVLSGMEENINTPGVRFAVNDDDEET